MPFSTRMTVMKLADGILVHSPTPLTESLRAEIDALGPVRWLVAPNRIHYWWMPEWHAAYPGALVYLAPRVREQAGKRIDFSSHDLSHADGYPWDAEVATLPVQGSFMTEVVLFHRASRTLVLTDMIENFEPQRFALPLRLLLKVGGVACPHGSMPRDLRLTFKGKQREGLRKAVETMLAWRPARVIVAHGRWFERDGTAQLRRAFGWLLD